MKSFKQYLSVIEEGGNVAIGGEEADRIDLLTLKRSEVVKTVDATLASVNKTFEKEYSMPLWNEKLYKSKQFLSGSAFAFFNSSISDFL